jgi:hypothetical protein
MSGEKGKTLIGTMAKGFVLEGPGQELPQTIAEELATGLQINMLDKERGLLGEDFAENVFGATLAGGLTGATIGAAGAQAGADGADPQLVPDRDPEDEPDPIADELRQILGLDQESEPTPPDDPDAAFEIKGDPTQSSEESLPIGAVARYVTPEGLSFIGRSVARATQESGLEEAQAAGIDFIEKQDEEGNVLPVVDVPGTVLRKEEETVFVPDNSEVTLLDDEEAALVNEQRELTRNESMIVNTIPKEHTKLRELLPEYLDKYPAGTDVNAEDKVVVDLQKTVETIKDKVGDEKAKQVVNDLIRAVEFTRQPQPQKQATKEVSKAVKAEGAQSPSQLRKERATLAKDAKERRSLATKSSALGFLAAKKADGAETLGINKEAAEAEGIDTSGRANVGGRTVFTKGGMSMDAAAELMNESGQFGKDITANDVVDIINDELAGRPNKFTGQAQVLAKEAAEAEAKLNVVDEQIKALRKKAFVAVREAQRNAENVFGNRDGVLAIEEALREGKLAQIYAEEEYFNTIANNEEFRKLTDLVALAEEHDAERVEELLNLNLTDIQLAQALMEIIDNEQDSFGESEETSGENEGEEVDGEGQVDVEEPTETTAEPGSTAEPTAEEESGAEEKPEVGPETTAPPPKPEPKPEPEPEPEPEIEATDEQVAKTLEFIAAPFEETARILGETMVNTKLSEDVTMAAIDKLVKDGKVVKEEGVDINAWRRAMPKKGLREPSQSAVAKQQSALTTAAMEDNRLVSMLIDLAEETDYPVIQATVDGRLANLLKKQYADAWASGEFFQAWAIAKLANMRFNKVDRLNSAEFSNKYYDALIARAVRKKTAIQKAKDAKARDKAISKRVGQELKDLHGEMLESLDGPEAGFFRAVAKKFIKGFRYAVDGKPKSTLTTDPIENRGYAAGRDWIKTPEGKKYRKGVRGKKEEGIGPRLQRIHDELGKKEWTDSERVMADLQRLTNRGQLFSVSEDDVLKNTGRMPSGGILRAADLFKSKYGRFSDVAVSALGGWASNTSRQDTIRKLDNAKREGEKEFQEAVEKLRSAAKLYVSAAQSISNILANSNNLTEARSKIEELLFKDPLNFSTSELSELGSEISSAKIFTKYTIIRVVRRALKSLEAKDSDPYVKPVRTIPLKWKSLDEVIVTESDRDGRSVTAKQFTERFGLLGLTPGNWVTSQQRTDHTNWMWDAYMNLSTVLGIDPINIGHGNTLYQTIGALGTGGKHAAHYSPNHPIDPNNPNSGTGRVINVTNTSGDGSVAHEWFHSLDYALDDRVRESMGRYQRDLVKMMSSLPKEEMTDPKKFIEEIIRRYFGELKVNEAGDVVMESTTYGLAAVSWQTKPEEKLKKIMELMLANRDSTSYYQGNQDNIYSNIVASYWDTDFFNQAKTLDGGTVGEYWSKDVELIARAGEAYVTDKLDEQDIPNNYLVNSAFTGDRATTRSTGYRGSPYPAGDERIAINALYDQWMKDIEFSDNKMPAIKDGVESPISTLMDPLYKAIEDYLKSYDKNIEQLRSNVESQSEEIKAKLKEEAEASARETEDLIEQTLASGEAEQDDLDVTIDSVDEGTIDTILGDLDSLFDESEQEESDHEKQSADARPDAKGAGTDVDSAGGKPSDSSTNAGGTEGRGPRKPKPQGKGSGAGGRTGGGKRAGGTGQSGTDTGTGELGDNESGRAGDEPTKPGGRSTDPSGRGLTKEEILDAANEAGKNAAQAGIEGLGDALAGLGELFGGSGKVNSFPSFDQDSYDKAKPLFKESYNKLALAGASLVEWMKYMAQYMKFHFGADIRALLKHFVMEANAGRISGLEEVSSERHPNLDAFLSSIGTDVDIDLSDDASDAPPRDDRRDDRNTKNDKEELSTSIFADYETTYDTPEVVIPEGWQTDYHPGKLVQSSAMASVPLPDINYEHSLPKDMTESGRVSPAQVENVLLAGNSFLHRISDGFRRAFFIGDGTGVGKGREIAAIMIDQLMSGKGDGKAVWFSENFKLFDDAVRDFAGVTGRSDDDVKNANRAIHLFKPKSGKRIAKGTGIAFQTYSTARSGRKKAAKPDEDAMPLTEDSHYKIYQRDWGDRRWYVTSQSSIRYDGQPNDGFETQEDAQDWVEAELDKPKYAGGEFPQIDALVEWLGDDFDGVIAFDEAHAMSNQIAKEGAEPTATAAAMLELRNRLPNARLLFVTATGATEVRNLGYLERLGLWGPDTAFEDVFSFISEMQSAGTDVMEMVAHTMKAKGVYNARQLSWDGVSHDRVVHQLSATEKAQWNEMSSLFKQLDSDIGNAGIETGLKQISRDLKNTQYINLTKAQPKGREQDIMLMMLTGYKTDTMLAHIRKKLADGEAAVIQLAQTGENATNRALKDEELQKALEEENELFTLTPKELLRDFIKRKFPVHNYTAGMGENSKGKMVRMAVKTESVNPKALAMRDALLARVELLETPPNAIDQVISTLRDEGIGVSEVTGRIGSITQRTKNIDAFMNDENQVLIFSGAGATGASYHASLKAKNQRRRNHYVLQSGWQADKVLQSLGRSHRADQALGNEPHYWLMTTDLSAELRFIATIMRRLEQIGSLTAGERKAGGKGLFGDDQNVDGPYTSMAIDRLLEDMQRRTKEQISNGLPSLIEFASITGLPILDAQKRLKTKAAPTIEKLLGRLLLAEVDVGNAVFEQFRTRLTEIIDSARESGTFSDGVETITADSIEVISTEQIRNADGLETTWLKVKTATNVEILTWEQHIANLREGGFEGVLAVKRKNGSRFFTAQPIGKKEGGVEQLYKIVGPWPRMFAKQAKGHFMEIVTESDLSLKFNKIESDGRPDFGTLSEMWVEEEQTWPGAMYGEKNFIVGDLLAIWDRMKALKSVQIQRFKTDDGRVFLGRFVATGKNMEATRDALQAELAQADIDLDAMYRMLLEGSVTSIRLSNNDRIKLRSTSDKEGAPKILVLDPTSVKKTAATTSRDGRIKTVYKRLGVTDAFNVDSSLFGFGAIGSEKVFKEIVGRFPIASIEGLDANDVVEESTKKEDPELWLEVLTDKELKLVPDFIKKAFDGQKLFGFRGKNRNSTFENKAKIKRAGARWSSAIKTWVIGEDKTDHAAESLKDVMSARRATDGAGMSVETVTDIVATIRKGWPAGPEVLVVNSLEEVTDLNFDTDTLLDDSEIAGVYQPASGKIWLIANALHGPNHVASVLAHEMWHAGIRALNLPGFNADTFLRRVFVSFKNDPLMKSTIAEYSAHDPKTDAGRIALADEYVAALAEQGMENLKPKQLGLIRRVISAIRKALGKVPLIRDYIKTVSDAELLDVMKKSFKAAMDYTGPTKAVRAETMFSVGRPKLLYGVNEVGDVKMAAVPNADGSYDLYTTEGNNLLDKGKLSKTRVASKAEVLKRMSAKALTAELKTKRFGPKPNSSEIHVNYTIPDETRWDHLVATFQDRFKRLNVVQTAFSEQGASIDPDIDTYRAEERFHGLVFERIRAFEDNLVEPLMRAVASARKEHGITQEDVDNYLYAKHAPEANARLEKMNPEAQENDRLSGRSNEWAEQTLNEFESRGVTSVLDDIAQRVYSINNKRLDLIEQEGLATTKAVKAMRDSYDFYVPLRGKPDRQAQIDGEDASGLSVGKGLSASGRERYRYGRHSVAQDMMVHSLLMMEETLIRAEKNRVGKTFLKFVQQHPNSDNWTVNSRNRKPRWDKDLGEVVWEARSYPPEQMVVWVGGKEHSIFIKDPILRKAMLGLNVVQVNRIVQGIAKVTRFLAAVNTSFNPEFAASNLLRDLQTALVNLQDTELLQKHGLDNPQDISKIGRQALKDLSPALRGAWNGLRKTDPANASESVKAWMGWFDDFRAHGGKIEFFSMNSVESKRKELTKRLDAMNRGKIPVFDQLVWLRDWVSDMNGAIENGIRLSTYKNLVEKGVDRRVAASVARNLTVNFNRKGEIGNFMNALFMFFNAGIQGTQRLYMAAKNPKIQKILMSLAAGAFFLAEMGRWIGGEDEDGENNYAKIPDWVKENNIVLMKADGSGGYYKIPLPYGYNVMNVIGVSLNKAWHSFEEGGIKRLKHEAPSQAVRIITGAMNAFNPIGGDGGLLQMASPTILDPFVQIASNENFFGAPIRPVQPTYLQYEKPQSELYWSSVRPMTRDAAKWLNSVTGGNRFKSGWIDQSPEDVDHIFDFMFGGAGAFVGRSMDWVYAVANDEDVKVREIPMVRRFVADPPEFVVPGRYRENISELQQTISSLDAARSDGKRQEASAIFKENAKIIQLRGAMKSTESRLRKLRAQRRKIQDSKLPDKVKKERVKSINERIDSLQKKFNKRFSEAKKVS